MNDILIEHTERHVHLDLGRERRVLGSCVLGGGMARVRHVLNLRVDENFLGRNPGHPSPGQTLRAYCRARNWAEPCAGFMTAASMNSLRTAREEEGGLAMLCVVTAGLSNARRAGDRADCRGLPQAEPDPGTINIIAATNAWLSPAAMVDAVMTITEAKAAMLLERGVRSPVSGRAATGTGTDALAVISGNGPALEYCGKHVLAGELLARAVISALGDSLAWYDKEGPWA